jgi:hypothetical protein
MSSPTSRHRLWSSMYGTVVVSGVRCQESGDDKSSAVSGGGELTKELEARRHTLVPFRTIPYYTP